MSAPAATAPATDTGIGLKAWLTLLTCTLVTTLYATTITIANVSLPQIQGAMSATPDQIAWVVTSNLIATAVTIPMAGWLSARFGRRRVMLVGVGLFAFSSIMCGASSTLGELIFWRIVQSASGSPLTPVSQSVVLDNFPGAKRGPAISVYGLGVVLGPTIAPIMGGYVSEEINWRWVFYILVPMAAMAFIGLLLFVKEDKKVNPEAKLDWLGFLSLAIMVSCIQMVLDRGERAEWYTSAEIIVTTGIALAAGWVFFTHTLTARKPFIDLSLLRDWNFAIGLGIALIFGMVFVTPMALLPVLLQQLRDVPDFTIGVLLAARGVGTIVAQIVMFFISARVDPRVLLCVGFGSHVVAGWAMANFDINVTMWDVAWTSALQGFGVGCLWVPITLVLFANLDPKRTPEGSSIFHFVRSAGSSYFISGSFVVIFHWAKVNYADLVPFITPFRENVTHEFTSGAWDIESLSGLAALSVEVMRQAQMIGFVNAFQMFTWVSLAVFPLIALLRWPPKPPNSGS